MKNLKLLLLMLFAVPLTQKAQIAICLDIEIDLDVNGFASISPSDINVGSGGIEPIEYTLSQSSFNCSDVGVVEVSLTAIDGLGMIETCVSTVTVSDGHAPVVFCNEVSDWPINEILTGEIVGVATDNCGISSTLVLPDSFEQPGTYTTSFIAFDLSGYATTCISIVHVIGDGSDNEEPIISECPSVPGGVSSNESCEYVVADFTAMVVATDNVTASENLIITQSPEPGSIITGVGIHPILFTVTDEANISSDCTMLLEVQDVIAPTIINCPINQTVELITEYTIPDFTTELGAYDNCSDNFDLTIVQNPSAGTILNIAGNHEITVEITDESGNVGACFFNIELTQDINVQALCQNIDVQLDASGVVEINAAMIDDGSYGSGSISLSIDQSTFICTNIGANLITLNVLDEAGNTGSCESIVTVIDNIVPDLVCNNFTLLLDDEGNGILNVDDIIESSNDNCGFESMTLDQNEFNISDLGNVDVELTIMDTSGNTASCISTVTVTDQVGELTAICEDLTLLLDESGVVQITPEDIDNGSFDDEEIVSMSIDVDLFDCANIGLNMVSLTVQDNDGNLALCTSIVMVEDFYFPAIETSDITLGLNETGTGLLLVDDVILSGTDNCGEIIYSAEQTVFSCANIGANMVNVMATDQSGNVTSNTIEVTVVDEMNPVAVCQDFVLGLNDLGLGTLETADIDGGSYDNCSIMALMSSQTNFIMADIGVNEVELTVTDESGNSSSCTAQVTVTLGNLPVLSCPGDMNLEGNEDCTLECPDFQDMCTVLNFCGEPSDLVYTQTPAPGELLSGTTEIIMVVSDDCENVQTCTFTVSLSGLNVEISEVNGALTTDIEADNYQWYYCNGNAVQGANQQTFTPEESGSYSLTVIVNSCSGNSDCAEVVLTGIEENEFSIGLSLYPNPNEGSFTINIEGTPDESDLISIFNEVGKLVYQEKNIANNTINFDLENESAGMYMLLLQRGDKVAKKRFIIE